MASDLAEIAAYYVPGVDHVLDLIGAPVAVAAGIIAAAGVMVGLPDWLRWLTAIGAGGAVATAGHALNAVGRAKTGAASGGIGNPVYSTAELAGSVLISSLAFIVPVIVVILLIEFCSGYMRNAIMQWYPKFAKSTGIGESFVASNWGMLLCVAGITGGMFAGVISDKVFDSRRGPMSAVLYGGMTVGAAPPSLRLVIPAEAGISPSRFNAPMRSPPPPG